MVNSDSQFTKGHLDFSLTTACGFVGVEALLLHVY
jgi:hypothetical protein